MAYVSSLAGENLLVQIGDGGTPTETFAHDCLLNGQRALETSVEMAVSRVPNCTDPALPDKTIRRAKAVDHKITFSGMLHATSAKAWQDWADSGVAKNVRFKQNVSGANGGWQMAGSWLLENFTVTGEPHEEQTVQGTLVQADAQTVTANA